MFLIFQNLPNGFEMIKIETLIELAYDRRFCSAHTHSAHKRLSAINVQEPKRLVALTLNLVSVQLGAGLEN